MEENYCQEMALYAIHQKDYDLAKHYGQRAKEKYLAEWSTISKTIIRSRMTKLQSLQAIVELNEFLRFVDANEAAIGSHKADFGVKVDGLLTLWGQSMPNMFSDPPGTWDDVITNRIVYMDYIEDNYLAQVRHGLIEW